ncbi:hypothetical protein [Embleya sp. NPDC020630]|uniref:hypothetical protein n=1 Tax=Embleya sp. NPDC020630 TaxID=3363979 RepID=UPI00378876B1
MEIAMAYEGPPQMGDHVEHVPPHEATPPGEVAGFGRGGVVWVQPHDRELGRWRGYAKDLRVVHRPPHVPNW